MPNPNQFSNDQDSGQIEDVSSAPELADLPSPIMTQEVQTATPLERSGVARRIAAWFIRSANGGSHPKLEQLEDHLRDSLKNAETKDEQSRDELNDALGELQDTLVKNGRDKWVARRDWHRTRAMTWQLHADMSPKHQDFISVIGNWFAAKLAQYHTWRAERARARLND